MSKKIQEKLARNRHRPTYAGPYEAGYDCGQNGANLDNCNFTWFRSPEYTAEWERGKADAEGKMHPHSFADIFGGVQ